jgi:hypothetical protein
LFPEQENAVDLLILDTPNCEVAEAVGVTRETVWHWRHEHPVFMAELERRRAEVWRAPQEKLRSLMGKAVANLAAAVEGGDLKASIEILKAVGMYGDGTMNAIHEQDPDVIVRQQAEAELKRKGISENAYVDQLIDLSRNPAYRQRQAEVEAEIRRAYLDE